MFWMIVLLLATDDGKAFDVMLRPPVAFSSEEKCEDAMDKLKSMKGKDAPFRCVAFDVIGGVPLESY